MSVQLFLLSLLQFCLYATFLLHTGLLIYLRLVSVRQY